MQVQVQVQESKNDTQGKPSQCSGRKSKWSGPGDKGEGEMLYNGRIVPRRVGSVGIIGVRPVM